MFRTSQKTILLILLALSCGESGSNPDIKDPFALLDLGPQECTAGQSGGFVYVMVEDWADNESLAECDAMPGADIDAICIFRSGQEIACAHDAVYLPPSPLPCSNSEYDDIQQLLGSTDGLMTEGIAMGFFSLNGGAVVVKFHDDQEITCMDEVYVRELHDLDDLDNPMEKYRIRIGRGPDCMSSTATTCQWPLESDWLPGEGWMTASWIN